MKILLNGFVLSLIFLSLKLSAADLTPSVTIKSLEVWNDSLILTIDPAYANSQNCSQPTQTNFILRGVSLVENQAMVSALLAAGAANKYVRIRLNGCGGGGYDYPKIERVRVLF